MKKLLFVLILIASMCFQGCEKEDATHSIQIFAMDTVIDITAWGDNAQQGADAARSEIYRLEKLFSVTMEESDIYRLNNSGGAETAVSDEVYQLLEKAKSASDVSFGKFDATIYPVMKLWGFTEKAYRVPADEEISNALMLVGYENIILSGDNKVTLLNGAQLDLGGIAKGYIGDKAAQAMKDAGVKYGLISLGGNVRTIGEKPDGEKWSIGIKQPDSNDYFATISTEECSVITSGAYQRNFTFEGVTYHHIIDPETGKPSSSDAVSVTVVGKDGALCDALSTALFAGGSTFAEEIRKSCDEFEYIILTSDNKVYVSQGLKDSFSLQESYKNLEIIYK